jgi:hypothetical protein
MGVGYARNMYSEYKSVSHEMQHLAVFILFQTGLLYMFRVLFASIIRSSKNCMRNHWYESQ